MLGKLSLGSQSPAKEELEEYGQEEQGLEKEARNIWVWGAKPGMECRTSGSHC